MELALIALLVFLMNIPFGALRSRYKKFTRMWWVYIHLPVPLVILLRLCSDIGFAAHTYPILMGSFFIGQLAGRKMVSLKARVD
ncbi:hypothetical protein [Gaoshiqia sediminis]|uniref:Uncharacterized protein n=1 Tax=Gaoshiqia sediminis TaxID=2986998 RepID=A0AA41Y450_9BACT|nr:hypothetical protein [Gaoshiqia sediminis]MCW0481166.1 hypothetical protein [Gaoshiqia sediminis]